MSSWVLIRVLVGWLVFWACSGVVQADYYRPADEGSDALYTPLSSFFHYGFDTLQLPDNFDHKDMDRRASTVFDELRNPDRAIRSEGGYRLFVNRQIFPVDSDHAEEWPTMLPNYFLHLFGGGLVYRRDLEYFRAHDYERPQLSAIVLAMTVELMQEIFEKKSTTSDDAIADFYLFRPLGIWLFSDDRRAEYIGRHLRPSIWPHLMYYDPTVERFRNAGISYVVRPRFLSSDNTQAFAYFGMNNLFGLSHCNSEDECLSWGVGAAVTSLQSGGGELSYDVRTSLGIFHDRRGSLLWSLILNGTEDLKLRANVYPLKNTRFKLGYAFGITDEYRGYLGVTLNTPVGVGWQDN